MLAILYTQNKTEAEISPFSSCLASQSHQGTSFPDQQFNMDNGNQPKGSNLTLSQVSQVSQVSRSEFLQGEPHPYALRPHHPSSTPPPSSGPRRHSRSKWTFRHHQTNRFRDKRQCHTRNRHCWPTGIAPLHRCPCAS